MKKLFFFLCSLSCLLIQSTSLSAQNLHPFWQQLVQGRHQRAHLFSDDLARTSTVVEDSLRYEVIVRTSRPERLRQAGIRVTNLWFDGMVIAEVTLDQIRAMGSWPEVLAVEPPRKFEPVGLRENGFSAASPVQQGVLFGANITGTGAIIATIDGGINFAAADFRQPTDATKSRILYIWDQTLSKLIGEATPYDRDPSLTGCHFGVEYSKIQIENTINGLTPGYVRQTFSSHGNNVALLAAANAANGAGVAPGADLLIIKSNLFETNVIHALTYIHKVALDLGRPVVVNMSFATHYHAHDGTSPMDMAIDGFVGSGRVVVASAGNDGNQAIHNQFVILPGQTAHVQFDIGTYTPNGGIFNDNLRYLCWFDGAQDMEATLTSPNGFTVTINHGSSWLETASTDGRLYLAQGIDGGNGHRYIDMIAYDAVAAQPPAVGTWTLSVTNHGMTSTEVHGWVYLRSMSTAVLIGGNTDYTIASPATSDGAIAVGTFMANSATVALNDQMAAISSRGPRRDGTQKPDLAAAGEAATSFSSPLVTGTVAMMLGLNKQLGFGEVRTLLQSQTLTDAYTGGSLPDMHWGYGKLAASKVIQKLLAPSATPQLEVLTYDNWLANASQTIATGSRVALRFTPSFTGRISGVLFRTGTVNSLTADLQLSVCSDASGIPGAVLGSVVTFPRTRVSVSNWHYADLLGTGVQVIAGTSYYIVIQNTGNFSLQRENSAIDNRSWLNTGTWALTAFDWRIRPVITTSIEGSLWTGQSSDDWNNTANWSANVLPSTTRDAVIPNTATQPIVRTGTTAQAKHLRILPGSHLTLQADSRLDIHAHWLNEGALTDLNTETGGVFFVGTAPQEIRGTSHFGRIVLNNAHGLTLTNQNYVSANLHLQNGVLHTQDLLVLSSSAQDVHGKITGGTHSSLTGNITFERFMAHVGQNGYRFFSSPLRSSVLLSGIQNLSPTMFNVIQHNETLGYITGWASAGGPSATLPRGRGLAYWLTADRTIRFYGQPQLENFTFTGLTFTMHPNINHRGWNLVGNPFPAALDWNAHTPSERNGVDAAMYYYDHVSDAYRGWLQGPGSGTPINAGSRYLAPMQGFFVRSSATGASLTFLGSARSASSASFMRISSEAVGLGLRLRRRDETVTYEVRLHAGVPVTHAAFDTEQEALFLPGFYAQTPKLYWQRQGQALSIQQAPFEQFQCLPLVFECGADGQFVLEISRQVLPQGMQAILTDHRSGLRWPLDQGAYLFEHAAADSLRRFDVCLEKRHDDGVGGDEVPLWTVPSADRHLLYRAVPKHTHIQIVHTSGQLLYEIRDWVADSPLVLPPLTQGMYLIRWQDEMQQGVLRLWQP